MLKIIEHWCLENSMTVNTKKDKSAIMPIGKEAFKNPEFQIHGQRLHVTTRYKYIGFILTSNGSWCQHVKEKILKAQGLLMANARFLADGTIPVKIRLDAGQALVVSQLKYGENAIAVRPYLAKRMESIQTQMNRMILGMPRPAKAAAMRLMLGTPSLRILREVAAIKYLQKVSKLPANRLVKQVFDRSQMGSYEATDLKCHSKDEMIKECQKEMENSHAKRVLEIASGSLHPIFERTTKQRACMAKWIVGARYL